VTGALLDRLGARRHAVYVQDYSAPVGWRLMLRDPDRITAVITQNGNAYQEGFVSSCPRTPQGPGSGSCE
jgi:pimeloyl-ACP methyl ester carboxylesterase